MLDAVAHRVAAAVLIEAVEIEPEPPRPLPQVRVLEAGRVGEQRVVHLPEAPLQTGGLGGARGRPGARVAGTDREMAKHDAIGLERLQPDVQRRAERALEVGVDDQRATAARSADVVLL